MLRKGTLALPAEVAVGITNVKVGHVPRPTAPEVGKIPERMHLSYGLPRRGDLLLLARRELVPQLGDELPELLGQCQVFLLAHPPAGRRGVPGQIASVCRRS